MDPKGPYDAAEYSGVSFYAKVGAGSTKSVRLKVPDIDTDPAGKRCTECFNDFGADLTLTDQWQKYTVPVRDDEADGRVGLADAVADRQVEALRPSVAGRAQGAAYDVWIDDVQFTGCP